MGIGAFQESAFQEDAFQTDASFAFTEDALRNPLFASAIVADLAVVAEESPLQVQAPSDPAFVQTDVPPHTVQ